MVALRLWPASLWSAENPEQGPRQSKRVMVQKPRLREDNILGFFIHQLYSFPIHVAKYFGIRPMDEQISARQSKFYLR